MNRVVVGVTGHRVLAEAERIATGVDAALAALERRFRGRSLTLLSALAEGADRVASERALARPGWALRAVLPLARADYGHDFVTPESRRDFAALLARAEEVLELPACASRAAAYAAAGAYVVDRSDALIAVWDGQPSQGDGGTADIVERARRRHLPLAWVVAGNRRPGTDEPTSLGPEQGRLIVENL